ncbi:DUF4189 domain-containing protein [Nocardia sp. NPDC005746]|uniref:DUF4189 domain-containing protein n=1 Tax=Nocardia sp. NPDC005746 TaxID=3157062 RepID=UPI0033F238B6
MKFMGKAVVAVAAVGLAAGSAIGAGTADAAGLYGAIAFSHDDWAYGRSVNALSAAEAQVAAIEDCASGGSADCRVMVTWANGCGALVYRNDHSDYLAVGTGTGRDRADALRNAYDSLAEVYPQAMLANVGSADLSATAISEVVCTANA